jgi:methyl-accepting chemotaxis protein
MNDKIRRKEFYSDFQFQFKVIATTVAIGLFEGLIFIFGGYMLFKYGNKMPAEHRYYYTLGLLVFVSIINAWLTRNITHRITGPLARFSRVLREISEGIMPEQILLRDTDFLQELETEFGDMITSLGLNSKKEESIKRELILEIEKVREAFKNSKVGSQKKEIVDNALSKMREEINKLNPWFKPELNTDENNKGV